MSLVKVRGYVGPFAPTDDAPGNMRVDQLGGVIGGVEIEGIEPGLAMSIRPSARLVADLGFGAFKASPKCGGRGQIQLAPSHVARDAQGGHGPSGANLAGGGDRLGEHDNLDGAHP